MDDEQRFWEELMRRQTRNSTLRREPYCPLELFFKKRSALTDEEYEALMPENRAPSSIMKSGGLMTFAEWLEKFRHSVKESHVDGPEWAKAGWEAGYWEGMRTADDIAKEVRERQEEQMPKIEDAPVEILRGNKLPTKAAPRRKVAAKRKR